MILAALHILCYDIWFYFSHIALHHPKLYFIHKIHHKKHYSNITYKDTNVAHWAENLIQPLGFILPAFYCFSPVEMGVAWGFVCVRGLMRHDHRWVWLVGDHHLLHHKHQNSNYGEYWIDWLFGTDYIDREIKH